MKLEKLFEGEKLTSVKTPTAKEIAEKHGRSVQFINQQLKMGTKVELEHVKDKATAREIALDHLSEIPDYYTRLKKMEQDAKAELRSRTKRNK